MLDIALFLISILFYGIIYYIVTWFTLNKEEKFMFEGNLKGYRIGQRNEVYPPGIGEGYPGYDYYHALQMKQTQEAMMRDSHSTVEIIVEIEPAPKKGTYIVRNKSTYAY